MRIGVDVMGGDHAPGEILKGCFASLERLASDDHLVLAGDRGVL
jgi:fatty acid/phospholipid biosynthesis enzyme